MTEVWADRPGLGVPWQWGCLEAYAIAYAIFASCYCTGWRAWTSIDHNHPEMWGDTNAVYHLKKDQTGNIRHRYLRNGRASGRRARPRAFGRERGCCRGRAAGSRARLHRLALLLRHPHAAV